MNRFPACGLAFWTKKSLLKKVGFQPYIKWLIFLHDFHLFQLCMCVFVAVILIFLFFSMLHFLNFYFCFLSGFFLKTSERVTIMSSNISFLSRSLSCFTLFQLFFPVTIFFNLGGRGTRVTIISPSFHQLMPSNCRCLFHPLDDPDTLSQWEYQCIS